MTATRCGPPQGGGAVGLSGGVPESPPPRGWGGHAPCTPGPHSVAPSLSATGVLPRQTCPSATRAPPSTLSRPPRTAVAPACAPERAARPHPPPVEGVPAASRVPLSPSPWRAAPAACGPGGSHGRPPSLPRAPRRSGAAHSGAQPPTWSSSHAGQTAVGLVPCGGGRRNQTPHTGGRTAGASLTVWGEAQGPGVGSCFL